MSSTLKFSSIIPFALSEKHARNKLIDWLIKEDSAPIDVAYRVSIKRIKKAYYPLRRYCVDYSASWSAVSIFEHDETYTEYVPKMVYVDYKGHEHNKPGEDFLDATGKYREPSTSSKSRRVPWTPLEKIDTVKKTKTVFDGSQNTYGDIGSNRVFVPLAICADRILEVYLEETPLDRLVPFFEDYLSGATVMPLLEAEETAWARAEDRVWKRVVSECKSDVPGKRYESFSVDRWSATKNMNVILLPMFDIEYEYGGKAYKCWLCGTGSRDIIATEKPKDEKLISEQTHLNEELKALKKKKTIFIVCTVISVFWGVTGGPLGWIFLIVMAIIAKKKQYLETYRETKAKIESLETLLKNYAAKRKKQKEDIAAVVKNDQMSYEQKRTAVQKILEE